MDVLEFLKKLEQFSKSKILPPAHEYLNMLTTINYLLSNEKEELRSGGVIYLKKNIPTLVLPDLHARRDFFLAAMQSKIPGGKTAAKMLSSAELQMVCLGDGFHGEARVMNRWLTAFTEFGNGYRKHRAMDMEMTESLETMRMVITSKLQFPEHFHFLKGNHENITNENSDGNYSFGKFVYEGEMVFEYTKKIFGSEFLKEYYIFEKLLPLLAKGRNFLLSHAEPARVFDENEIQHYRDNPEVTYGLTWTDNGAAESGSVVTMLKNYFPDKEFRSLFYFGGHRPVSGLYNIRAGGKYVQLHNPNKWICTIIPVDEEFEPERHIYNLLEAAS